MTAFVSYGQDERRCIPRHGEGGGPGVEGLGDWLMKPRIISELKLSDEQVKTLRDKAFALEQERIKLRADLDLAALEQAKLLAEDTVNEKALMAAVEKTGSLRTELAKLRMQELLLVRRTLTAEQRAKLRGMLARLRAEKKGGEEIRREGPNRGAGRKPWRAPVRPTGPAAPPPAGPPAEAPAAAVEPVPLAP